MFNPRQYGVAQPSSAAKPIHREDLQCNELTGVVRRSALPPKIAPTGPNTGRRRIHYGHGRGSTNTLPLSGPTTNVANTSTLSLLPVGSGSNTSSQGGPSNSYGSESRLPINAPHDRLAPSTQSRASSRLPRSSVTVLQDQDMRSVKRQKTVSTPSKGENPFSTFVQSQALCLRSGGPRLGSQSAPSADPGPFPSAVAATTGCIDPIRSSISYSQSMPSSGLSIQTTTAPPLSSTNNSPSSLSRHDLSMALISPSPISSEKAAEPTRTGLTPQIKPLTFTSTLRPSSTLSSATVPLTTNDEPHPNIAQPSKTSSEQSSPVHQTPPSASLKSFPHLAKEQTRVHPSPSRSLVTSQSTQVMKSRGRASGNIHSRTLHNRVSQCSLPLNSSAWSDEPSSVPGNPQQPPTLARHLKRPFTKQTQTNTRPFNRGRVQRPTALKLSSSRPQPIPIPTPTSRPKHRAPSSDSAAVPTPTAGHCTPPIAPAAMLHWTSRSSHELRNQTPMIFATSPETTAEVITLKPNGVISTSPSVPLTSQTAPYIPKPTLIKREESETGSLSFKVKPDEPNTEGLKPAPFPKPSPSWKSPQLKIGSRISSFQPDPSIKREDSDFALPSPIKAEPTEAPSYITLLQSQDDDKQRVAPVEIKREKPEVLDSTLPQRKLVTQSCSFYPIPNNCRKSVPGYKENRVAFFRKEYRKLQKLGLRKEEVVFRDDGLAIEWSSPVPVWSDTLRPEVNAPPLDR
ncbi:hypothetical protein NP233_g7902 [Leucocoprinus birnbaumii]|uniref:Uncharacterized protein n=1 Tax=Leucocoprinus birnbaumii TaxID=56174 RepID=A0AAD5VNA2_9AGAR|nr:hypothetical protein NP233_g7902 [Leucocoprinus birnbaumii]